MVRENKSFRELNPIYFFENKYTTGGKKNDCKGDDFKRGNEKSL